MIASSPRKLSSESISSLPSLCRALDITPEELKNAINLPDKYEKLSRPKSDGSLRIVYNPRPLIRKIQRRINNRILSNGQIIQWPEYIYGSIPNQKDEDAGIINKDYVSCASRHCGAKSILKLDIKDFFDNIHQIMVEAIFRDFLKYDPTVSKTLSEICCFNSHVVQGGLTSSYLASLCLFDVEGKVVEKLQRKNLVYTRLVDDITISSKAVSYDFGYAKNLVLEMLQEKELPLNEKKTKIQRASSEPLSVHGLRVIFKEPRLPADEVRRIRAAVKNLEGLAAEPRYRITHAYRHDFNRCMGRVNKLSRVGHKQHSILLKRLKKIFPLPAKKDVGRILTMIRRLEKDHEKKKGTYWYHKRFYAAHERLNILQRLKRFNAAALYLRKKLFHLSPTYE
jgi:RNA-directed DNA polymerase